MLLLGIFRDGGVGDESFCYAGDDVAGCVPGAMVNSGAVVYEEEKVVICDAFGRRFMTDRGVDFGFEFGEVDVDVEGVEGSICVGKTEERSFGGDERRRRYIWCWRYRGDENCG